MSIQTGSMLPWWCHQMETFSLLLALCEGNPLVTAGFPSQRPVMQSFDVFFDLCLNKWLSKQSRCWWFEMPLHLLWRHCFYWLYTWRCAENNLQNNLYFIMWWIISWWTTKLLCPVMGIWLISYHAILLWYKVSKGIRGNYNPMRCLCCHYWVRFSLVVWKNIITWGTLIRTG